MENQEEKLSDNTQEIEIPDQPQQVTDESYINDLSFHSIPSEDINIVPHIKSVKEDIYSSYYDNKKVLTGEGVLKEMGQVVVEEYKTDELSRTKWKENVMEDIKLFSSSMDKKDWPWKGASNVCLPLLTVAVLQFQARTYDALIPPKEVVKILNFGSRTYEEINKADRVQKYMNFQLLYKMEDFEEGMDKTLLQLPIEGSVFRKTYYDSVLGMNRSIYISALDFVVNYGAKDLGEETRKTHVLRMTKNDIRKRIHSDVFDEVDGMFFNFTSDESDALKETSDEIQGIEKPDTTEGSTRIILEQHRGWDLDGDGIEEPYVITVDLETEKVLRITDRRYIDSLGRQKVVEYFTHYTFIPNPLGFYGYGYGTLLRGLNAASNSIVNEVIDAGSLANLQGGFVSKRSGIKKGSLTFAMGEFKEIDTYIDDVRKAIYDFNFKGPNQTLYAVLGLLYEHSKLVASVSETMTGQLPASDTPATTVLALIEEGRKVFSSIQKRIHRAFKKELRKLFRLNGIFLNKLEYFKVIGDNNAPEGPSVLIGRNDFTDSLDIIPVSDPNITSRAEKIIKAQQVKQEIMSNPLTANNPEALYIVTRNLLTALDIPNVDDILKPPPPPQDIPPIEENAMMIQEKTPQALPQQDHVKHIKIHEDLLNGAFSDRVSPQTKKLVDFHDKEHLAMLYQQTMGGMESES